MEFLENTINSSNLVNSATILSLFLAIIFFVYQEYKRRKERQKEILQLQDQIINLVIRNHVNSGITISKIDIKSFINGFEMLKNCKLRLEIEDITQMIYAKVYENEHIPRDTRLDMLRHLEELIGEFRYEITDERQSENDPLSFNITRISAFIMIGLFMLAIQFVEGFNKSLNLNNFLLVVLITLTIIVLGLLKPIMDKFINYLIDLMFGFIKMNKTSVSENKTNVKGNHNEFSFSNVDKVVAKEVKFEEYFNDNEGIRTTLEQRVLIESMLRQIYYKLTNENTTLPLYRITTTLVEKEIISKAFSNEVMVLYKASSYVVHEGKLPPNITEYNQLINGMQDISNKLYKILNTIKDEDNKNSA
ncbi:hypothetical protein AAV98_03700 [Bacillus sp. CHD6a]|nr:hypothetical protein AAV98_03700 [Bacillus sp. CHD6a]